MRIIRTLGVAAICSVALGTSAKAVTINEAGDAGQLLGTAQVVGAISSGDNILGSISPYYDVDLYSISVGAGLLTFNTFATPQLSDPQLWLFNSAGNLIGQNDDTSLGNLQSQISLNLLAGTYFVGISVWNNDPTFTGGVLSGWNYHAFTSSGNYNITFVDAQSPVSAVPLPAALPLFAGGLGGLGAMGWWRRRKAI